MECVDEPVDYVDEETVEKLCCYGRAGLCGKQAGGEERGGAGEAAGDEVGGGGGTEEDERIGGHDCAGIERE